ncbi:MAG: Gfo/Idh/MocA family oxidoreductase [Acidobacteriota bacterium]
MRQVIRWGVVGCGDVVEFKSGPGFQEADGSSLLAVTRRDRARAEDFARRHGVPRVHATADDLIADPEVDAIYIATPPSSHRDLALRVAAAGKPCLVEKPMAMTHAECLDMVTAFERHGAPLWVAYYRRALPRFLKMRDLLRTGAIGRVTSVQVEVLDTLPHDGQTIGWRVDPATAGAGLFFDVGSHCLDMLDFLVGPIDRISGFAENTGGAYDAEDVTVASLRCATQIPGSGVWNFNTDRKQDSLIVRGTEGAIATSMFKDVDVVLSRGEASDVFHVRNPPYVHQPLIQSIVDELLGRGRCESTGESGARASWALERCVAGYYSAR